MNTLPLRSEGQTHAQYVDTLTKQINEVKRSNNVQDIKQFVEKSDAKVMELRTQIQTITPHVEDKDVGVLVVVPNAKKKLEEITNAISFNDKIMELVTLLQKIDEEHKKVQKFIATNNLDLISIASSIQEQKRLLDEFVLFHDRPEIEAEKIPTTTTGSSNVLSTATKSSVTPSGRKAAPVYPTFFVQLKQRYGAFRSASEQYFQSLFSEHVNITSTGISVKKNVQIQTGEISEKLGIVIEPTKEQKPKKGKSSTPNVPSPTISLACILSACEILGILNKIIEGFSDKFSQMLDVLMSGEDYALNTNETGDQAELKLEKKDHKKETEDKLAENSTAVHAANLKKLEQLYHNITTIINFIHKYLTNSNPELKSPFVLTHHLGKTLGPSISEKITQRFLAKFLPEKGSELVFYTQIMETTISFESKMRELDFLSSSDLSHYVERFDLSFSQKKCEKTLSLARTLLLSQDHSTVLIDETTWNPKNCPTFDHLPPSSPLISSLFVFPKCQIHSTTKSFFEKFEELLTEACTTSYRASSLLIQCCRKMLLMMLAIVPTFHEQMIGNVPLVGILVHNDMMYIAHQLLTVEFKYKSRVPPPANKELTFIDFIPKFREMAQQIYNKCLAKQQSVLMETFSENLADGSITGSEDDVKYENILRSIKQLNHKINRIQTAWKDALPSHVYVQALSVVVNHIMDFFLRESIKLKDIPEKEAERLHVIFQQVWEFEKIFTNVDWEGKEGIGKANIYQFVPNWAKFKWITEILEMPLATIADCWNTNKLPGNHHQYPIQQVMTKDEVIFFIMALFSDSDLRRQKIKSLV